MSCSYYPVSLENTEDNFHQVLTVKVIERPGWVARFFGAQETQHYYRFYGNGTVWHHMTLLGFQRCSLAWERRLFTFWTQLRYEAQKRNP